MPTRPFARALPLLLLLPSASLSAPVARLESEPVHLFGKTEKTVPVVHSYRISNPGDAPLKLTLGAHCECTSVALKPAEIPPKGRGEIELTMDPAALWGSVKKQAIVATNDPERPELQFVFTGSVVSGLRAEPSQIFFGTAEQQDILGLEKAVVLYSASAPVRIEKVETTPEVEARTEPLTRTHGHLIWLRFKSKPAAGAYQKNIVVFTDHEESPTRLSFAGVVQGRVSVQPAALAFRPDDMGPKTLRISWSGQKPLKVTGAVSRFEGLEVDVKRAQGEQAYVLEARFPGGLPAAQRAGSIEVSTDDKDNATLRVPVLIMGGAAKP